MGTLLVAQGILYTPFQKGIYALNEQNGKLLWSHSSKVSSGVSFALNDGKIFGTENDGKGDSIIELDASNGKLIAQHPIEASIAPSNGNGLKSADLVSANATYVISPESNLDALDNQTGIRLWSVSLRAIGATAGIELVAGV
jgi:outer membrane protein assembly factor BamB